MYIWFTLVVLAHGHLRSELDTESLTPRSLHEEKKKWRGDAAKPTEHHASNQSSTGVSNKKDLVRVKGESTGKRPWEAAHCGSIFKNNESMKTSGNDTHSDFRQEEGNYFEEDDSDEDDDGGVDYRDDGFIRDLLNESFIAQQSYGRSARQVLVLIHIAKTGGASFEHDMAPYIRANNEWCLKPHLDAEWSVMAFRSPRHHVLSQYVHCSTMSRPAGPRPVLSCLPKTMTADLITGFPRWLDHFMEPEGKASCGKECRHVSSMQCSQCRMPVDFNCYNPNNMQARHLTCTGVDRGAGHFYMDDAKSDPDASEALTNLQTVKNLVIAELYEVSLCAILTKLEGEVLEKCKCEHSLRNNWTSKATHNVPSHDLKNYSDETLAKVDALTKIDRQIYEAAVLHFVREVRDLEKVHNEKILCDDQKARFRSELQYFSGLAGRLGF